MITCSCNHVVGMALLALFFLTEHALFPFLLDGHLDRFYILATVNSTAMNIGVPVFFFFFLFFFAF